MNRKDLQNLLWLIQLKRPWSVARHDYYRNRAACKLRKARRLIEETEVLARDHDLFSPPFFMETDLARKMITAAFRMYKI